MEKITHHFTVRSVCSEHFTEGAFLPSSDSVLQCNDTDVHTTESSVAMV